MKKKITRKVTEEMEVCDKCGVNPAISRVRLQIEKAFASVDEIPGEFLDDVASIANDTNLWDGKYPDGIAICIPCYTVIRNSFTRRKVTKRSTKKEGTDAAREQATAVAS